MPNKPSAMKELRKSKKLSAHNTSIKKNLKYLMKQADKAIERGDKAEAIALAKKIQKASDKAAKVNVIKANKANRQKSKVMTKANSLA